MLRKLIKHGWRVVTEAHTTYWLVVDVLSALIPTSVATGTTAWLGEHSIAILAMIFVFAFAVSALAIIVTLGYRAERQGTTRQVTPDNAAASRRSIDRIPLIELRRMAAAAGWNFVSQDSLHLIDLVDAIRQGAIDGTLTVWGRLNRYNDERLMRAEPLDRIPVDHWREFRISANAMLAGDNFYVQSWSPNEKLQSYVDLHVERTQAAAWLRSDAEDFKGRTRSAS